MIALIFQISVIALGLLGFLGTIAYILVKDYKGGYRKWVHYIK